MKCRFEFCRRPRVKHRSVCQMCLERVRRYRRRQQGVPDEQPVRRWAPDTNPRTRARHAVFVALRRGSLSRPTTCSACKRACTPDADHCWGYAPKNRLRIKWLCRKCHRRIEVARNRIEKALKAARRRPVVGLWLA